MGEAAIPQLMVSHINHLPLDLQASFGCVDRECACKNNQEGHGGQRSIISGDRTTNPAIG